MKLSRRAAPCAFDTSMPDVDVFIDDEAPVQVEQVQQEQQVLQMVRQRTKSSKFIPDFDW